MVKRVIILIAIIMAGSLATMAPLRAQAAKGAPFLDRLAAASPISITVAAPNGDRGPRGLAVVPDNFPVNGLLKPGAMVVSLTLDASGAQQQGRSLMQVAADGSVSTFFTAAPESNIAFTGGVTVLQGGFVAAASFPLAQGKPQSGSLVFLDRNGKVVADLAASGGLIDGPYCLLKSEVNPAEPVIFVSNWLSGIASRVDLTIEDGKLRIDGVTRVCEGFGVASPFGDLFALGPTGLYLSAQDKLSVVDSVKSQVSFSPGLASALLRDAGPPRPYFRDPAVKTPIALFIAPNRNLVTINLEDNMAVEFTQKGRFVAQFPLAPDHQGAIFSALVVTRNGKQFLAFTDSEDSTVKILEAR